MLHCCVGANDIEKPRIIGYKVGGIQVRQSISISNSMYIVGKGQPSYAVLKPSSDISDVAHGASNAVRLNCPGRFANAASEIYAHLAMLLSRSGGSGFK